MSLGRANPPSTAAPLSLHYGPDPSQLADLWLPAPGAPEPAPVAVVLHGGFWRSYFTKQLMDGLCASLAAEGWASWNVEYRRLGGGGGFPQTLLDVAAAIDFLAGIAEDHGLRRRGTVAIGHSAGAQLALWAAARGRDSPGADWPPPRLLPAAVLSLAGLGDLELCEEMGLGIHATFEFLGGGPGERPERYALASPSRLLPLGVPVRLIHGVEDRFVPIAVSERYLEQARRAGDDAELLRVGEDHLAILDPGSQAWSLALAQLAAWRSLA